MGTIALLLVGFSVNTLAPTKVRARLIYKDFVKFT